MAQCILMKTGGGSYNGDAQATDVLSGKTFYSNDKDLKTGTMTNNGTTNLSVTYGTPTTIPQGYHDGNGKATASACTQTILWTNSNTTAQTFGNQTITLSQSMANFDYLLIKQKIHSWMSTSTQYDVVTLLKVSDLSVSNSIFGLNGTRINGYGYFAYIQRTSNTELYYYFCNQYSDGSKVSRGNTPVQIIGIKGLNL